MQVYIMRHGEAVTESLTDAERQLTQCGMTETRQMAAWLALQQSRLDRLLVSPYVRAQQTCQLLSETMKLDPTRMTTLSDLIPAGEVSVVADYLHGLALEGVQQVMVIAHLPLVGYLVSELCPDEMPPMFATAGIASIEYDAVRSRGELLWQRSPARLDKAV